MKRNPVAWAALIVASAALLSSAGFLRTIPAAPKVSDESHRTAEALSEAFGAVAEFVRPSVVQISVQKKAGRQFLVCPIMRRFQNPNPRGNGPAIPKDFEELAQAVPGPGIRATRKGNSSDSDPRAWVQDSSMTTAVTS